ncbi:unnamed protein product, partial [Urochloa humidicola]
ASHLPLAHPLTLALHRSSRRRRPLTPVSPPRRCPPSLPLLLVVEEEKGPELKCTPEEATTRGSLSPIPCGPFVSPSSSTSNFPTVDAASRLGFRRHSASARWPAPSGRRSNSRFRGGGLSTSPTASTHHTPYGEQSPGATMTSAEKLIIAHHLARLGVDIIEAGFPGSSPDGLDAVRSIAITPVWEEGHVPIICGLSRCNKDIGVACEAVKHVRRPRIHTFVATSEIHMQHNLRKTPEQVVAIPRDMVAYARSLGCPDV